MSGDKIYVLNVFTRPVYCKQWTDGIIRINVQDDV